MTCLIVKVLVGDDPEGGLQRADRQLTCEDGTVPEPDDDVAR
jgi:hypothetical protein